MTLLLVNVDAYNETASERTVPKRVAFRQAAGVCPWWQKQRQAHDWGFDSANKSTD
ncbi:hypothetical protein [Rubripirellula reticaptiva]|uniref:Uncharacterized protein n=1 Tax=Rubripirellula reticaptiva TaxID=2528013 RepID=A0A5C6F4H3_9BACT|nr:hypothetical protein [Rubripirellula reticaptiva]TWU56002.1 hypothetical protein Poly59_23050 [Rubripirellula reticaptiva]